MITLRPYQVASTADIRRAYGAGHKWPLYVLPTGGGKTVLFAHIAHGAAAKGNRVLILCHRIELIDQISRALDDTDTAHGFIAAGYPKWPRQTMIASVQTLVRRLDALPEPQLIIVDEAHHARAATYETILARWPRARVLGVTATPVRQSGEGLGKLFDCMVLGPSVHELIEAGYLARYRLFSPPTVDTSGLHTRHGDFVDSESEALLNKPSITGSALEHYRQHAHGLPALAFCVSIEHATAVAAQFRDAGYSAVTLNGTIDREVRRGVIRDFRAGRIQVVTSCDVLNEGLDCPGAHCGIFLRPTQSVGLYLQQIGRVLRPCEGKSAALLLDHVGNASRHGLPDAEREWSLEGEDRKKKKAAPSIRVCTKCFAAMASGSKVCSECGAAFPVESRRQVEQRKGELVELTPEEIERRRQKRRDGFERASAQSLTELQEYGRRKGYRHGWAQIVFNARQQHRDAK